MKIKNNIAIRYKKVLDYPSICPFDPSKKYPELPNIKKNSHKNIVYDQVRNCFIDLKMDYPNIGTPRWSPFSDLIKKGDTVVIKPNLVLNTVDTKLQEYTTSHPSVIRPIIDYCWKALKGKGTIIVGDAPSAEADFDEIVNRNKIKKLVNILKSRGINVKLVDFRSLKVLTENGIWTKEISKQSEATPATIVNLGRQSHFYSQKYDKRKLHGAGYDIKQTSKHHKGEIQEYSVAQKILSADLVISVPKFKTHRKAGITCCLKNLVGINTDKNFLPHFSMGSKNMGGDEMPNIPLENIGNMKMYNLFREYVLAYTWKIIGKKGVKLLRFAKKKLTKKQDTKELIPNTPYNQFKKNEERENDLASWLHQKLSGQHITAGAWSGNETICRMILDLNKIFLCCNKKGELKNTNERKVFYIVDAVKIGTGNGPTNPTPINAGVIAAGYNGFQTDIFLMTCFGVNYKKIPLYKIGSKYKWLTANNTKINRTLNGKKSTGREQILSSIQPPDYWFFK